ncbi:MAG: hypothetical protein NTZ26_13545 [Candidatus Aminicenantes bacterium]|nr:hypothetical protein [Candidatus Aminicenantes bacterium]
MDTKPRPAGPAVYFGLCGAGLLALVAVFGRFGIPAVDTLKFLAGLLAGVFLPGLALVRLLRLDGDRVERLALVLTLGFTASTLLARIAGLLGLPILLWAGLAAAAAFVLSGLISHPPKAADFRFRVTRQGLLFGLLALLVLAALWIDNYRNGITLADGSVRYFMHFYDGFTRTALTRELSHAVPPQMPFAAGLPISYHYDMNLFAAEFYKYLGLSVADLFHRMTITFYFAAFLLSAFVFIRRWARSTNAALLGSFLAVFGTGGFGWVSGLLAPSANAWGQTFFSFYYIDLVSINPILPALAVFFAGAFALHRYFESRRAGWMLAAAFLLAVITGYKMTFAVPVLGGLAAVAAVYLVFRRETAPLKLAVATALMTAPLLLLAGLHNIHGPAYGPQIAFNDWVSAPLFQSGLTRLAETWRDLTHLHGLTILSLAAGLAGLAVFFAGGFGASLLGLPSLLRRTFRFRREDAVTTFLGAVFLAGIVLFFWASPRLGLTPRPWIVVDIYKLSALILLAAAAGKAIDLGGRARGAARFVVPAVLILLSIPNTVQFAAMKAAYPDPKIFRSDFLEACRFLEKSSGSDAVVLYGESITYVPYFADRRAVLDRTPHAYLPYHLESGQLDERRSDIKAFLADPAGHGPTLAKYGVTHVMVKRRDDAAIWKDELPERIDCPPYRLTAVFRNFRYAVFRADIRRP